MLSRPIQIWNRYRHADERQLALFPDWERAQWLAPMPSIAAALALLVLFVVGTPSMPVAAKAVAALEEPAAEAEEPDSPEYDLAAIPDYIKAAAQRYRLSESLIAAVISVESNWDHEAVSPKGARGLMQLMPQTSAAIGVRDPHSPDQNIDAGASHLRAMLDTFKDDLPLALAAYNAGEQNVIRYHGVPPYPETRRFVARVLRKMGDRQTAERVMARPIPTPVWTSRTTRQAPAVRMLAGPTSSRPTLVPLSSPRTERASQVVLQDGDVLAQPAARPWGETSAAPVIPTIPTGPAPILPFAESP
jgi:hypothetical protein